MGMRKYERAVIKARCIKRDGNAKNFSAEWKKYHDAKVKARIKQESKDGKTTVVRNKPITKNKNRHYGGKEILQRMRLMKQMIADMKKQAKEKKAEEQNDALE